MLFGTRFSQSFKIVGGGRGGGGGLRFVAITAC